MRRLSILLIGCMLAGMGPGASMGQPGHYGDRGHQPPPMQSDRSGYPQQGGGHYYYNGRWVDQNEWQRHSAERDRWAQRYHERRGHDDSSAVIAGILGFALGAAIVGSQQQAEHARTADQKWDDYCARKYRSYDRHSRTYLGVDGLRHYCQ